MTAESSWPRVRYGDILTETEERAGDRTDLPVLSVTKTRGLMLASERFGKVMHGRELSRYRVARRGQIVADPMLLWDGAIGAQRVVEAGLVSPDYRVYAATSGVNPEFLAYLVRSPHVLPFYQGGARGTNVRRNRIARSDFLAIPIALPTVPEQQKIAAILSSVDEAIEATDAVIAQLQAVKKAMMADLLTKGLPGRHTDLRSTRIGPLPANWKCLPIGEVLSNIESGWSPQCENRAARAEEWGVLKVSAVSWGRFDPDENKKLPDALQPRTDAAVREGDVLLSRANTPELVGRSVYVDGAHDRRLLSDKILRLRPRPDLIEGRFLNLVLGAASAREQIQEGATGSSRSMKNISQEKLRAVQIPVPPVEEQTAIAAAVDSLGERVRADEHHREALVVLRSALMSALLTGEIRVRPVATNEAAA